MKSIETGIITLYNFGEQNSTSEHTTPEVVPRFDVFCDVFRHNEVVKRLFQFLKTVRSSQSGHSCEFFLSNKAYRHADPLLTENILIFTQF